MPWILQFILSLLPDYSRIMPSARIPRLFQILCRHICRTPTWTPVPACHGRLQQQWHLHVHSTLVHANSLVWTVAWSTWEMVLIPMILWVLCINSSDNEPPRTFICTCIPSRQTWHCSVVGIGCGIIPCISDDPLKWNGADDKKKIKNLLGWHLYKFFNLFNYFLYLWLTSPYTRQHYSHEAMHTICQYCTCSVALWPISTQLYVTPCTWCCNCMPTSNS